MEQEESIVKPRVCIRGWELSNLDPELFDTRVVEVFGLCKDCESLQVCENPSESVRELVPKTGHLVELGSESQGDEERDVYYALIQEERRVFILVREHKYFWTKALFIAEEDVPPSLLESLP